MNFEDEIRKLELSAKLYGFPWRTSAAVLVLICVLSGCASKRQLTVIRACQPPPQPVLAMEGCEQPQLGEWPSWEQDPEAAMRALEVGALNVVEAWALCRAKQAALAAHIRDWQC